MNGERDFSGSAFACFLGRSDEPDPGTLSRIETLALLILLLEGERAGARGVDEMTRQATDPEHRMILRDVARGEARFCAMLTGHIKRLGGAPSAQTGRFYAKLAALWRTDDRLDLLERGQGWVVRKLSDAMSTISDDALREDLAEMLEVHLRNIERCDTLRRPA